MDEEPMRAQEQLALRMGHLETEIAALIALLGTNAVKAHPDVADRIALARAHAEESLDCLREALRALGGTYAP